MDRFDLAFVRIQEIENKGAQYLLDLVSCKDWNAFCFIVRAFHGELSNNEIMDMSWAIGNSVWAV